MSLGISPEAEAQAAQIPNITERLERFIAEQYALEKWRAGRRDPEIESILAEATGAASGYQKADLSHREHRDALFRRFLDLNKSVSNGHAT